MNNELKRQCELFEQGISCTKIAKLCNTTTYKVIKNLRQNGYVIKNKQNEKPSCIKNFVEEYKTKQTSISELAKKYNLSDSTIRKWLHKENIETPNLQNVTKFNENVFDRIDTEEKAYWLGFIFADGYIAKRRYTFELSLAITDKEHLYKFNSFMQYQGDNVKLDFKRNRCRWSIVNKHLWNVLNNYGCVPKKSLVLKFPNIENFRKELAIAFIRGYCDGDGSLFLTKNNSPRISILGTEDVLSNMNDLLLNQNKKLYKHRNNLTKCLCYSGISAVAISYMLYYCANIYLERKYQKFLQFQNCRFKAKALKLLEGKIGEGWDANPELIADIKELQQCNA